MDINEKMENEKRNVVSSYEIGKNYFECYICSEEWIDKNPKILYCQHTFCKNCLLNIYKENIDSSSINCPTCNKITYCNNDGIDGIADNLIAANISRIDKGIKKKNYDNYGYCKKHKSEFLFYCHQCSIRFCIDCYNLHKNHRISTINELNHQDFQRKCLEILENVQYKIYSSMQLAISDVFTIETTIREIIECVKSRVTTDIQIKFYPEIYRIDELKKKISNLDNSEYINPIIKDKIANDLIQFSQDFEMNFESFNNNNNNNNNKKLEISRENGLECGKHLLNTFNLCLNERLSKFNYCEIVDKLENICNEKDFFEMIKFNKTERIISFPSAKEITAICTDYDSTGYTYIGVLNIGETGKIYKLDENDRISLFQFIRKPIKSILSYKKEIFILSSDSFLHISNFISYETTIIANIDSGIDAVVGDNNSFLYITNNKIGKLIIGSDYRLISDCEIGPYSQDNCANYKNICTLNNRRLAVISSTFLKGFCIWLHGQRTCDRSYSESFGEKIDKIQREEGIAEEENNDNENDEEFNRFKNPSGICSIKEKGLLIADSKLQKLYFFYGDFKRKPLIVRLNFQPEFVAYSEKTDEIFVSEKASNRLHIFS